MRVLILSDRAIRGIDLISNYIAETSERRARRYQDDLHTSLNALLSFPEAFPVTNYGQDQSLRRKVFRKRTIILHRVSGEIVYIEAVLDARSNWAGDIP